MTRSNTLPPPPLRPARYGGQHDVAPARAMLARCSPDTLHRRFHTPTARLSERSLHQLLMPRDGWSMVAERDGDLVGLVSVGELSPVDLEVGIVVEDAHQHQGIGAALLRQVALDAAARGYEQLHCLTQPDNHRVAATAQRAGLLTEHYCEDGVLHLDIRLEQIRAEGDTELAHPA